MAQATKPLLHKHEHLDGTPAPLLKPSPVAQSLGAVGGWGEGEGKAVWEGRCADQINALCERDPISNNNQVRHLMLTSGLYTHMHTHMYIPPTTTAIIKENDKNYFFFFSHLKNTQYVIFIMRHHNTRKSRSLCCFCNLHQPTYQTLFSHTAHSLTGTHRH